MVVLSKRSFEKIAFSLPQSRQAGIGGHDRPEQLLVALEPEAASIYCRGLRTGQLATSNQLDSGSRRRNKADKSESSADFVLEDPDRAGD